MAPSTNPVTPPVELQPTYTFRYFKTDKGVDCVLVTQPHQPQPFFCVPLDAVHKAATTGLGRHPPGVLACGPGPGWVVGYFPPSDLLALYDNSPWNAPA